LLKQDGKILEGKNLLVTDVPLALGRKYAERLIVAFGSHLTKSLSRNTDYVVIGNEKGLKK